MKKTTAGDWGEGDLKTAAGDRGGGGLHREANKGRRAGASKVLAGTEAGEAKVVMARAGED